MFRKNQYINPYVGGFFIGLMMIAAYFFSGEGLGSSGGFRDITAGVINGIAPKYAESSAFYKRFVENGRNPFDTWLVYEMIGIIMGAIISAALFNRLKFEIGKSPNISNRKRLLAALLGGLFWGIGSQLGRGCTSGLIMSGMAVSSLSGYIGLIAVFGGGFLFAYFFRKLWV